ncbi:DUF397 domain-containing protein [Streptomyces sp. NPDC001401]|uniref:DUF397 domain-containing protein n=1 Tax=Streptomyces sp. NPDC001401 TaxID=3364570 RepID=UPI0036B6AE3C
MPPSSIQWHKSSYSNGMGGECLEVAALAEAVAIRDSKVTSGPQLILSTAAWHGFIRALPPHTGRNSLTDRLPRITNDLTSALQEGSVRQHHLISSLVKSGPICAYT